MISLRIMIDSGLGNKTYHMSVLHHLRHSKMLPLLSWMKSFLNSVGFEHSLVIVSMPWMVAWMPWMHVSQEWTPASLSLKTIWVSFANVLIPRLTHSSFYYLLEFAISVVYSGFYCFRYCFIRLLLWLDISRLCVWLLLELCIGCLRLCIGLFWFMNVFVLIFFVLLSSFWLFDVAKGGENKNMGS